MNKKRNLKKKTNNFLFQKKSFFLLIKVFSSSFELYDRVVCVSRAVFVRLNVIVCV